MDAKSIFTSKTFWFNLLFLLVGVASAFGYREFVPDSEMGNYILVAVTIINIALRLATKQAVTLSK